MKQFVRIGVLCAAVAALALGSITGAGAGLVGEQGEVIVTPPVSEVGGTVTIANADDDDSTCNPDDGDVVVEVYVYKVDNPEFEEYFEPEVDEVGNWSIEFDVPNIDAAIGEWEVDAFCDWDNSEQVVTEAYPVFYYPIATFEVVGADVPVPDAGTEAAEEVRTAPRFTG